MQRFFFLLPRIRRCYQPEHIFISIYVRIAWTKVVSHSEKKVLSFSHLVWLNVLSRFPIHTGTQQQNYVFSHFRRVFVLFAFLSINRIRGPGGSLRPKHSWWAFDCTFVSSQSFSVTRTAPEQNEKERNTCEGSGTPPIKDEWFLHSTLCQRFCALLGIGHPASFACTCTSHLCCFFLLINSGAGDCLGLSRRLRINRSFFAGDRVFSIPRHGDVDSLVVVNVSYIVMLWTRGFRGKMKNELFLFLVLNG